MSTTVYRIQDAEGRGPYRPGFSHRWTDPDATTANRQPIFFEFPNLDLSRISPGRSGCAFRTLDQLLRWFTPFERQKLAALGYSVVSMEADEILAESEHQLVFTRRLPLAVGAISIPIPQEILA